MSQKDGVYVGQSEMESKVCVCVCVIFLCFDLSPHYLPLPVVKCMAVIAAQEVRRRMDGRRDGWGIPVEC